MQEDPDVYAVFEAPGLTSLLLPGVHCTMPVKGAISRVTKPAVSMNLLTPMSLQEGVQGLGFGVYGLKLQGAPRTRNVAPIVVSML